MSGSESKRNVEEDAIVRERRKALLAQYDAYLSRHPDLTEILHDFLSDLLVHQPEDVFAFAREYFSRIGPPPPLSAAAKGPRPVVVCGPSGVGKGTLIEKLLKEFPDKFGFSVSHTTRAPRPGEVDGKHYFFTTRDKMETDIANGLFLESAEVHGNLYGTSVAAVRSVLDQGRVCILDIDVQGAKSIKKSVGKIPVPLFLFVMPPSWEELENRLRHRGTETEEKIRTRLANARGEAEFAKTPGFFDNTVVNDNLDKCYEDLREIIIRGTAADGAVATAASR